MGNVPSQTEQQKAKDVKAASALQNYTKNLELDITDPFEPRGGDDHTLISDMPAVTLSPAIHTKLKIGQNLMDTDFGMQTDFIIPSNGLMASNMRNIAQESQTKSQNEIIGQPQSRKQIQNEPLHHHKL